MPDKLLAKASEERLEEGKIREKLRSHGTGLPLVRKTESEKKRGPLVARPSLVTAGPQPGVEKAASVSSTSRRPCRTPSPPPASLSRQTHISRPLSKLPTLQHAHANEASAILHHHHPRPPSPKPAKSPTAAVSAEVSTGHRRPPSPTQFPPSASAGRISRPGRSPSNGVPGLPRPNSPIAHTARKPSPRSRPPSPSSSVSGRRTPSPASVLDPLVVEIVRQRVKKVQKARLYLLGQVGPHSFLVAADSPEHKYKVIIGPQSCTCGKGPHCIHLLFVMLRVFQIKEMDSRLYCRTLKNFEVEELVQHYKSRLNQHVKALSPSSERVRCQNSVDGENPTFVTSSDAGFSPGDKRQEKSEENSEEATLCPICLLDMVEGESLEECQRGCHNKLHHHCISVWAEECRRQNEPILCPLCRAEWPFPELERTRIRSQEEKKYDDPLEKFTSIFTCHSEAATPTGESYDFESWRYTSHPPSPIHNKSSLFSLPHSTSVMVMPKTESLPCSLKQKFQPWIQVFGIDLVTCLFSRHWVIREKGLQNLSQKIISLLNMDNINTDPGVVSPVSGHMPPLLDDSQQKSTQVIIETCCHVLETFVMDPVYKVYIACLRCLRGLLAYSPSCHLTHLQEAVRPVIKKILLKCGDGSRRSCQLSVAALMDIARGQAGAFGVGSQTRYPAQNGLGGVPYVLSCILYNGKAEPSDSPPPWQWVLGRLLVLERLIEDFPKEFGLLYVPLHMPGESTKFLEGEGCSYKLLNYDRLMAILEFSLKVIDHPHSTVNKMARKVFIMASSHSAHVPAIFRQVYNMLSTLSSTLQMHLVQKMDSVVRDFRVSSLSHLPAPYENSLDNSSQSFLHHQGSFSKAKQLSVGMLDTTHQERTLVTEKLVLNHENSGGLNQQPQTSSSSRMGSRNLRSASYSPSPSKRGTAVPQQTEHLLRCQSMHDIKQGKAGSPQRHQRPSYLPLPSCSTNNLPQRPSTPCHTNRSKPSTHTNTYERKPPPKEDCDCISSSKCCQTKDEEQDHEDWHCCCHSGSSLSSCNQNHCHPYHLHHCHRHHPHHHSEEWDQQCERSTLKPVLRPFKPDLNALLPQESSLAKLAETRGSLKKCRDKKDVVEEAVKLPCYSTLASSPALQHLSLPIIPGLRSPHDADEFTILMQPNGTDEGSESGSYIENVHWVKGTLLGTGAFSSCYQARDVKTGTLMAVKQVSFCRNTEEEQERVMKAIEEEIIMMAKLDNPNIIRILGATLQGGHFNVFVEWMAGGSISALLDKYGPFSEGVIVRYTYQVLSGVAYLHDNHILHRDLKGANLLVDSTGHHLRIADFGAAARLESQETVAGEFQGQLLGTIAFMAPEVLRGENYGRSCDVWSVGCVMIEMATTRPPWNANDMSNHLALIFKIACSSNPPPIPEHLSQTTRDLALQCLEIKSELRPPAKELLNHPCFASLK